MAPRDRCPKCGAACGGIYERQGVAGVFVRIPGWAYCREHGPFEAS